MSPLQHCTPDWDGDQNCTLPVVQVWAKPLPGAAAAVFVANHGLNTLSWTVNFSSVPGLDCAGSIGCSVWDVWAQGPAQETLVNGGAESFTWPALASHDSGFIVVHPPA